MGATPTYALRYPEQADPADVPTDMHELALDVEAAITGAGVPKPVVNGQWIKGVGGAAVWQPLTDADIGAASARLAPGAYQPPASDFNSAISNGWYYWDTATANRPLGGAGGGVAQVIASVAGPGLIQQIAYDSVTLTTWRRLKPSPGGAWTAWTQVWPTNLTALDDTVRMPSAGSAAICYIKFAGIVIEVEPTWRTVFSCWFPATLGQNLVVDFHGGVTNNYEGSNLAQIGGAYTIRHTAGVNGGEVQTALGSNTIAWNWYGIGGGWFNFNAIVRAGPAGAQFSGMWIVKAMGY